MFPSKRLTEKPSVGDSGDRITNLSANSCNSNWVYSLKWPVELGSISICWELEEWRMSNCGKRLLG